MSVKPIRICQHQKEVPAKESTPVQDREIGATSLYSEVTGMHVHRVHDNSGIFLYENITKVFALC